MTELGARLRRRRERLSLTQEWVARALGVPRELLSYWETGARTPRAEHLRNLARIYRTTAERLLSEPEDLEATDPLDVMGEEVESEELAAQLASWGAFLGRWAGFLAEDLGRNLPGPASPPPSLAEPTLVVDRRRASAKATLMREHWELGQLALPELYTFLDRQGILVIRKDLGGLGVGEKGVSGAFFNHADLGFCVVLNAQVSPARQAFTLAHGIAHAMFHHSKLGILCHVTTDVRVERFGDAFGEHFLVPAPELRRRATGLLEASGRNTLEPVDGLVLANLFRVSFPTITMRLASEGLVSEESVGSWRRIDGRDLAERLGMEPPGFPERRNHVGRLSRYPSSVLTTVAQAVTHGRVSVDRAAEVLAVETSVIEGVLLAAPPEAGPAERREHDEFEQILSERR